MQNSTKIIRKINCRKIFNLFLLQISYCISIIFRKAIHWGKPTSISIEPTTSCNLSCPECPSGLKQFTRPTGNLNIELYKNIIDQTYKNLSYHILYFQGEPYLHKDFFDMIAYTNSKRVYTSTSTNGHFLTDDNCKKTIESGLNKIIISIDGTDQETYQTYRKDGDFNKVIEGTRNLVKWRKQLDSKTPLVEIQFLVTAKNEHQIEEMKTLANDIGADKLEFKTAQIYDFENGNELIPANEKYSRYKKTADGKYQIKNKMKNRCWRMWSSLVVCHDGKVVPCCFDKDAKYQLGDVSKTSINDIWKSNEYKEFRTRILKNRKNTDICQNCTE